MSEHLHSGDVTCTLTEEKAEERTAFVHSMLGTQYERSEEHPHGYTITFKGTAETLSALAFFIAEERLCCSFAEFQLSTAPPYSEIDLTITGREGTKALFEDFIEQLEAAAADMDRPVSDDHSTNRSEDQRKTVREQYADVALQSSSSNDTASVASCCGDGDSSETHPAEISHQLGYSSDDLASVAPGANLGLGCGNPAGIASLSPGDVVVDLGSGAGFDCFLAAQEVGEDGQVIGVDMTPEMIELARENIEQNDVSNVEFRLGEIEHLPVADATVDVIISNCVVNLSPNKHQVFKETFRVLTPGGRLAISDIVVTADLPDDVRDDPSSVASCIAGGSTIDELDTILRETGFEDISIEPKEDSAEFIREWDANRDLSEYIVSATIEGTKPQTIGRAE